MKVAIINQHPCEALGGSEIQCDIIATGLHQRGHNVCYVAPFEQHLRLPIERPYQVTQVDKDYKSIVRAITNFSPHIVYWRYNRNCFRPVFKKIKQTRSKFVFAVSNKNDLRAELYWKYRKGIVTTFFDCITRWLDDHAFSRVDGLTVLNSDYLDSASCTKRYKYIRNAMHDNTVNFNWRNPYIAWISNIKAHKRPEDAIALSRHLSKSGVDLLMIGKVQSSHFKSILSYGNLPRNCHFLGPRSVEEVNGILKGSLFHVHTCLPEGFGNVFIQAWLQGRPTVSLHFDPCGYIEKNGLGFFANGSVNQFYQQVDLLLQDFQLRAQIGQRARIFANGMFSVDRLVDEIESFFDEILSERNSDMQ